MARVRMTIDHLGCKRYVGRNEGGDRIFIDGEEISIGVSGCVAEEVMAVGCAWLAKMHYRVV
jgi:hypothetical protein